MLVVEGACRDHDMHEHEYRSRKDVSESFSFHINQSQMLAKLRYKTIETAHVVAQREIVTMPDLLVCQYHCHSILARWVM